jgi:hypothetical protein
MSLNDQLEQLKQQEEIIRKMILNLQNQKQRLEVEENDLEMLIKCNYI